MANHVLYVVVCGAGPAGQVSTLVAEAQARGWDTWVITTPAALGFVDANAIEAQTGHPVRSDYRGPDEPRASMPPPMAIVVAPATFNTINKLAAGISDNYALGILAEGIGLRVPVIVLPFINSALADRRPLKLSIESLRAESVRVLLGPGWFEPHAPRQGGDRVDTFPWLSALTEVERTVGTD
jgi:phosphopantothenoylcysteine synthetase/decarboxylase